MDWKALKGTGNEKDERNALERDGQAWKELESKGCKKGTQGAWWTGKHSKGLGWKALMDWKALKGTEGLKEMDRRGKNWKVRAERLQTPGRHWWTGSHSKGLKGLEGIDGLEGTHRDWKALETG